MMILYIAYLLFQIGTHKEEFDEEENVVETEQHLLVLTPHYVVRHHGRQRPAQRNLFCLKHCFRQRHDDDSPRYHAPGAPDGGDVEMINGDAFARSNSVPVGDQLSLSDGSLDPEDVMMPSTSSLNDNASSLSQRSRERRKALAKRSSSYDEYADATKGTPLRAPLEFVQGNADPRISSNKSHDSDIVQQSGVMRQDSNNEGEKARAESRCLKLYSVVILYSHPFVSLSQLKCRFEQESYGYSLSHCVSAQ
jgi:hypothetical protein